MSLLRDRALLHFSMQWQGQKPSQVKLLELRNEIVVGLQKQYLKVRHLLWIKKRFQNQGLPDLATPTASNSTCSPVSLALCKGWEEFLSNSLIKLKKFLQKECNLIYQGRRLGLTPHPETNVLFFGPINLLSNSFTKIIYSCTPVWSRVYKLQSLIGKLSAYFFY